MKNCEVDGCDRISRSKIMDTTGTKELNYCDGHRHQYRKHGSIVRAKINTHMPYNMKGDCEVPECTKGFKSSIRVKQPDGTYVIHRVCRGHYSQLWRHGKVTVPVLGTAKFNRKTPRCTVWECDRVQSYASGHCRAHYNQLYRWGKITNNVIGNRLGESNAATKD